MMRPARQDDNMVTAIENPGLNLDWLNLETDEEFDIKAGRKGVTLQSINQRMAGIEGVDQADWRSFAPRGIEADPRSNAHARQYRDKGDVWSESAMLLYEEALQRQWSSARDIPWDTIGDQPDDIEKAMCTLCTFLTQ
ncbi:MAG: hypothetical protein F4Y04_02405, partial [Chloroflexi bacterium]|nr:hypothetical protein [Chloroflexota bacterium]